MKEHDYSEESAYVAIYNMLLMSGEYQESEIDAQVHEILDNPQYYPEYFRWKTTTLSTSINKGTPTSLWWPLLMYVLQ